MITAQEIRWGMIYPLIIALVAVIAAHFGRRGRRDVHPWGPALAIAAGFVVAFIGVTGRWTPPTRDVYAWLVIAAGAGVVVSIIASIGDRTRWLVATLSVAVLIATAVLLAWRRKAALVPREFWLIVTIFAGGLVLWWAALEPLATRMRGATLPLLLSAVGGTGALVLTDGGTARFGKIAGGVAMTLLAIALLSIWLRDLSLARGGILVSAIAIIALLVAGYLYADVTWVRVALLAAAPLFAWVGALPFVRARRPWVRFAITAVVVLSVVTIAAVPAAQGLRKTMQEQTESYMYQ